jgi:hypothetical protein
MTLVQRQALSRGAARRLRRLVGGAQAETIDDLGAADEESTMTLAESRFKRSRSSIDTTT